MRKHWILKTGNDYFPKFPEAEVKNLLRTCSNHSPIIINLEGKHSTMILKRPFECEAICFNWRYYKTAGKVLWSC